MMKSTKWLKKTWWDSFHIILIYPSVGFIDDIHMILKFGDSHALLEESFSFIPNRLQYSINLYSKYSEISFSVNSLGRLLISSWLNL